MFVLTRVLVAAVIVSTLGATARQGADRPFRFTDIAAAAGLTLRNVAGSATKDYILESNGNGAAFFDFDNDGDMDVLLANGSTLERLAAGGSPMLALYRNDGGGRFTDVTIPVGLTKRGWGSGVCIADYD